VRASVQTHDTRCSYQPLTPNYAHFNGLSILHRHNKRNHAAVRKVHELKPLAGLVQAGIVWHVNEAQKRAQSLILGFLEQEKDAIANRPALTIGALARKDELGLPVSWPLRRRGQSRLHEP